jgi:hypothetical protein
VASRAENLSRGAEITALAAEIRDASNKCGLRPSDPLYILVEKLTELMAAAALANPWKPEMLRQAIRSSVSGERWRYIIIACAAGCVVGGLAVAVPSGLAGYYIGYSAGVADAPACIVRR